MDLQGKIKLFSYLLIHCVLLQSLSAITIQDKLKINQNIENVKSLLFTANYEKAEDILISIKKDYSSTEFNVIANYYLSLIEYNTHHIYPALHYIELALKEIDNPKIHDKYRSEIYVLAGILYYKSGLFAQAQLHMEKCLEYENQININTAHIYLTLIFYDKKILNKSAYYFRKIDHHLIKTDETKIYEYLRNFIGWRAINTEKIGYGDPNVNCIFAENDEIYIGLWHGGLIRYNYIMDTYRFFGTPEICGDEIRGVCSTGNEIWIGTTNGISILNKRDDSIRMLKEMRDIKISVITGDAARIIIGTLGNGVYTYNVKTKELVNDLSSGNISSVYAEGSAIFVGTFNSQLYEIRNGKITDLKNTINIKSPITAISKNSSGYCFATYGGGIITCDTTLKSFKTYNSLNNHFINNDFFLTTAENENIFYCGSLGNGIYYIENNTINKFDVSDYYSGNDIQKIVFYRDYMFIATLGEGVIIRMLN